MGYAAVTSKFVGNAAVQDNTTGAVTYFNSEARKPRVALSTALVARTTLGPSGRRALIGTVLEGKDNINPKYDVEAYTLGFGYRF